MDDRNVLLIPDSEFLLNGFDKYIRAVISSDIEYASKLSVMYWRGRRHINEGYRYVIDSKFNGFFLRYGLSRIHPRELANALTRNEGLSPPALEHIFNTSYEYVPLSDALRYRKLFSNSVVFKAPSHWEQWYYHQLQPFKHFIPLSSLHPEDILKAYRYCERNRWKDRIANNDDDTDGCDDDDSDSDGCDADGCSGKISGIQSCSSRNADMDRSTEGMVNDVCEEIADAASAFVRKLTYEYAVKYYEIH